MTPQQQLFYVLEVKTQGASASIGLNGVPLLVDRDGAGLETARAFNQWIKPGENVMHLFVNWPPDKNFEEGVASTEARLFTPPPGASGAPAPGVVLGQLAWPLPGAPERYPGRLETKFEVEEAPPVRLWSEAERVEEIERVDHRAMVDIVNEISERIKTGNPRGAYELLAYKFRDEELAEGKPPGTFQDVVVRQFGVVSQESGLSYEPITVEQSHVRLLADGHVALLERIPPSDAFVMTAGGGRFRFATYFAKIDGSWTLVR